LPGNVCGDASEKIDNIGEKMALPLAKNWPWWWNVHRWRRRTLVRENLDDDCLSNLRRWQISQN
jgi:hypothetical protein